MRVGGKDVTPVPLTLRQYRECVAQADPTRSDAMAISFSCGLSVEEAEAWLDEVSMGTSLAVVAEVMKVSALDEGAQFPDRPGDDAEPERAGV